MTTTISFLLRDCVRFSLQDYVVLNLEICQFDNHSGGFVKEMHITQSA